MAIILLLAAIFGTVYGSKPYFPTLQSSSYPTLLDDSPPGTLFYNFTATDDGGFPITFSLESNIEDWLEIDSSNGVTKVKKKIDREAMIKENLKKFKVYATNSKNETGKLQVIVNVIDVNNKSPYMTNVPQTINITEDTPVGSSVLNIQYIDEDENKNIQTQITIISGNTDGSFRLINTAIYVNRTLDFDNGIKRFVLNISARNTEPPYPETFGLVTVNIVNVDDLGLNFTQMTYTGDIIKGSPIGTPILTVDAYDLDGLNEKPVEYAIIQATNNGSIYKIDKNTGQISVNGQLRLGPHTIFVTARSAKHGLIFSAVYINVVATTTHTFYVNLLEGQTNAAIMDLKETEPVFNASGATFTIQSGNDANLFTISLTTILKIGGTPLDRETRTTQSLVVRLEKNGGIKGFATIFINVLDVNDNTPQFEMPLYDARVDEDTPVGSTVLMVKAEDPDFGINGTVIYTIANHQDFFSIENTTGRIILVQRLDREKESHHLVTVEALDNGSPPRTNTTNITINVIDINDNSPVVTPAIMKVSVNENVNIGFEVTKVTANDVDEGENGKVSYSIQEGANGFFAIDGDTGAVTTLKQLSSKLNAEYEIAIVAKDHGKSARSTNVFLLVNVLVVHENNHKPVFTKSTYITGLYKDSSTREILTTSAKDGDTGTNGEIKYRLLDSKNLFYLDSKSGRLEALGDFASKEGEVYKLFVEATDLGSPPKSSDDNALVTVFIFRESASAVITAGVSFDYLMKNKQEFLGVLGDLTDGEVHIKQVSRGDSETTRVTFNVVDTKELKEKDYDSIVSTLKSDQKQQLMTGKYQKWRIETKGRPKVSARTTADGGGMSAVVGAMICLAVMIGIGGIIMILILVKKKRERKRVRKAAKVTFNDKPQFIDPVNKSSRRVENAQEAQEVIVHMDEETSSEISEEIDPSIMRYTNAGYHPDGSDADGETEESFYMDGENVNFSTFLPPPPAHPPPSLPTSPNDAKLDSEDEHSISSGSSEEESDDRQYINAVLPPHEDFADNSHVYDNPEQRYSESPTYSVTDSTMNLVDPTSYKSSLLHDPSFGFAAGGLRASTNNDLTTEL